jgi:ribonuclease HII
MAKRLTEAEDRERVSHMHEIEHEKRAQGYELIAGVDEAGRGPLAGPVYTAAVILPPDIYIPGINDSKKLSEKKRDEIFDMIIENAIAYKIERGTLEEIEQTNILAATLAAMERAINGLSVKADFALIDGNRNSGITVPNENVIKGDAKSISIAAASILAKVSRDREIIEMSKKYPGYGFEKHKGYGTPEHIAAIERLGMCEIHRKGFVKKALDTARKKREKAADEARS